MAIGHHVEFLLRRSGGSRYITVPNFVIGQTDAEILQSFDFSRWPSPKTWILKLAKFYLLTVSRGPSHITKVETYQPAKFRQNRSIGCKDIRFVDFSRWRPSAVLDLFGPHLDHQQRVIGGLYHSVKFGYDWCSSFDNMNVSIFSEFGWKTPIHAPKIVCFWQFGPLKGMQYQPKQKGTPLIDSASFKPSSVNIWWAIWPVGELLKS